jgi:hypothetical protein
VFAEDDNGRLCVFVNKHAAQHGADGEHVEIVSTDVLALNKFGLTSLRESKFAGATYRGQTFKTLDLVSIIDIVRIRDRRAGSGRMRMVFTILKIAVFKPIPSAREMMATSVKPGDFDSTRKP